MESKFCPLTGLRLNSPGSKIHPVTNAVLDYEFEPIGRACITDIALAQLPNLEKSTRAKLAGICRNAFENGEKTVEINSALIANLESRDIPSNLRTKASHFLKFMYDHGGKDYQDFEFSSIRDFTIPYAVDEEEFNKIIRHLERQGFIQIGHDIGMAGHRVDYGEVIMTDSGIHEVEKVLSSNSKQSPAKQVSTTNTIPESTMDVFISHSSHDVAIARVLIELIRSALNISPEKIRCTSVEGYKLPGGTTTDDQIKKEVFEAKVLLGIISPVSVNSMYVAFELGARWSIDKPLIPLTTSIVGVELLKGPLRNINALNSTKRADVLQLITDLGTYLSINPAQPSVYDGKVDELVALSQKETLPTKEEIKLNDKVDEGNTTEEFQDAEEIIKQHCLNEWPEDFSMRAYCINKQKNALDALTKANPDDIPAKVFQQIRRKASVDWPFDYEMRLYAENEQITSYRQLYK